MITDAVMMRSSMITDAVVRARTAKNNDDFFLSNNVWADIGGISVGELNELELLFLKCIGWSLLLKREVRIGMRAQQRP
jgi:hypothetical protein